MDETVCFTICARNYLGYARTLFQSLRRYHPHTRFVLFLADEPDPSVTGALEFACIAARDLAIPNFADMTIRYDLMELATAIKPTCFQTLFNEEGVNRAIYLDPDILVTAPLFEIEQSFAAGAELVLTPHIREPYFDDLHPDDQQIMNAGTFNLGFAAMADTPAVRTLLNWWQAKLVKGGHNDLANGQFVDQRYMDMAPSFVAKTVILHNEGYNGAYWNLHERKITRRNDQWFANDQPLAFFHFSGVVPADERVFSKHQNRFLPKDIGELAVLHKIYLTSLNAHEQPRYAKIPYAYDRFSGGEPISPWMRWTYAHTHDPRQLDESMAISLPLSYQSSWFTALDTNAALPALLVRIWSMRPDLQKAFPIGSAQGRKGFIDWFVQNGEEQFRLPPSLIAAIKSIMGSATNMAASSSLIAKSAGRILSAAPSLRPLYRHVPTGIRSLVKTALYRTHGRNAMSPAISNATGTFDPQRAPGVHLYGYLRSQSGIGQGVRGLAQVLKGIETPLAITAFTNPNDQRESHPFVEVAAKANGMRIALIDANAEQVMRLEELVDPNRLKGTYRIAYWVWELEQFPKEWIPAIAKVDAIWVPSTHVAHAVQKVTDKPVTVIPHLIQDEPPAALGRQHFSLPEDRTIFLTSFDVNSFIRRKNPGATIQAFRAAFDADSPGAPILAIKVHGSHGERETRQVLESYIGDATNIAVIDQTLRRDEYLALHHLADVFVSLHRAEGFGLNMAEAMVIGKPVIATNYSGNCDFLDDQNGIPIGFSLVDIPHGAYPHGAGQRWAEAEQAEAISAMQRLAIDRRLRERLGKAARVAIIEKCGEPAIARLIEQQLRLIDPSLPL